MAEALSGTWLARPLGQPRYHVQVVCGHLIQLFWSEQTGDLRHGDQYKLESAPAVLLAVGETVILLTSPLDPY